MMDKQCHTLSLAELSAELNTDLSDGLSIREARSRLDKERKRDGGERRSLFIPRKSNYFKIATSFFLTPGIIILLVISLLAAIFGSLFAGISVLLIALAGAMTAGIITQKAQRKLDAMHEYASPMVKVKRGGNRFYTDGRNAVEGDIIIFSEGDLLPCDARLISSDALVVKELIYTKDGIRNRIVKKNHSAICDDETKAPGALNMVYAGSAVVSGKAEAVVTATGGRCYLAGNVADGVLSCRDDSGDDLNEFKPMLYRLTFVCISMLMILSLLSLVTLREISFVSNFLMLLSSVSMVSLEVLKMGQKHIFASKIEKLSSSTQKKKKKDLAAHIRDEKTLEALTKVTDIALLGRAAISDGVFHVGEGFICDDGGRVVEISPNSSSGTRILTCMHMYLKALGKNSVQNSLVLDGIADALMEHIKQSGFDMSGASLIIRSLYYSVDSNGDEGYACAETTEGTYRVAMTFDRDILQFCKYARSINGIDTVLLSDNSSRLSLFIKATENKGGRCMYIVSESQRQTVLEGVISLFEHAPMEISTVIPKLRSMGIHTTVMLAEDEINYNDASLAMLFDGKIAYATEFKKNGMDIKSNIGDYCAYAGFAVSEYAELIRAMRKHGSSVAAYGIDNCYYEAMSCADLSISCDIIRYSSQKYRESVYEKLACEGRDTNIRCSQMTRLLSKVLIHRTHAKGGGLLAITNAIRKSRGAYVAFAHSILFFATLMCTLIPITAMSALVGVPLLNSVQTASLAIVGAVLSMLVFSNSEPKDAILNSKVNFNTYPIALLKSNISGLVVRAGFTCLFAVILKILDATLVFGEKTSYTMPMFISMLFVAFAELFLHNIDFTKRGEGRTHSWLGFLFAYAFILFVGGIITQTIFADELFPNGIGTFEFLIVPAYCILYVVVIAVMRLLVKKAKKI